MQSTEGYVTTEGGFRLFFRKVGNGPQTVLIPNGLCLFDDFERLAAGRTLVFYDLRNRGHSDHVDDASKLRGGIQNDVDDLETVRRYCASGNVAVIGHSYMGVMAVLYAMKHGAHVDRLVQVGPMQPDQGRQYSAHLTGADATLREVFARLAQLQGERGSEDPAEFCRRFWAVLGAIYVTDPADAGRIDWGRCDLPNERSFMKYWTEHVLPSIRGLDLSAEGVAKVKAPVLTIHGTRDRSAPYGGGRHWSLLLPNARLVTVEDGGHAPWVEAPGKVFSAIETFLGGTWPQAAEEVKSLDPKGEPA